MEFRRAEELLERIATGIEKIADEPILQTEGGPPACPHCNTLNPTITVAELGEASGPFVQYFIDVNCGECDKQFWAVPIEWAAFTELNDAVNELKRRAGALNGNGGN